MFVQSTAYSFFANYQDRRLKVCLTGDDLQEVDNLLSDVRTFAIDTETNGLKWFRGDRSCGISFSARPHGGGEIQSYYLPFRHVTGQVQADATKVLELTKRHVENSEKVKILHNRPFDDHMLRQDDVRLAGLCIDTMIEARLYNEDMSAKLKERAALDLGDPDAKIHEDMLEADIARLAHQMGLGKNVYKEAFGYSGLDIFLAGKYAAHDTLLTLKLHEFYEQQDIVAYYRKSPRNARMRGCGFWGIWDIEMELARVLTDMEEVGIPVDVEHVHAMRVHCLKERERAMSTFFSETGLEWFELGSDEKLREGLQSLRIRLTKLTDKGNLAVDNEVLSDAMLEQPAVKWVIRWRDLDKLISTYTTSLLEYCDELGVLHGSFQQLGARTGRLSCRKPNLQNQPSGVDTTFLKKTLDYSKEEVARCLEFESVKRIFIVQRDPRDPFYKACYGSTPGGQFYRNLSDYSQVELRVLAHYTGDARLVQTYRDNGDIHDEVERAVFGTGKVFDAEANEWKNGPNRRKAKSINFGLCMAAQTPVYTYQDAYVAIEDIQPWHLLWDGVEWVRHEGLVCSGEQEVMTYDGLTATPEHEVYCEDGYRRSLRCAAHEGKRMACGERDGRVRRYDPDLDGQDGRRAGLPHQYKDSGAGAPRKRTLVYDLLNSGPRRRFTAAGKIVSNSYMMSPMGFSRQIREVTPEEAEMYFNQYNEKFPGVDAFRTRFFGYIRTNQCRFDNMFGRTRRVPAIVSSERSFAERAKRQAIATLIQGTAAELMKQSLVFFDLWLRQNHLRSRLVNTVHDEAQTDGPIEEFAVVARAKKSIMEDFPDFMVPIVADAEYTTTHWGDKHPVPGL